MLGDRIRRALFLAVIAVTTIIGAVFLAPGAKADGSTTNRFVADTNAARATAGLPLYTYAVDLAAVAQGQADRMASRSDVYHNPNLGSEVPNWNEAGENVGAGANPDQIHDAFMASPGHRANILSDSYTEFGIGTAVGGDGRLYVAEVFRLPSSQPQPVAADEPAPAQDEAPAPDPVPAPTPVPEAQPAPAPAPAPAPNAPVLEQVAVATAAATQVVPPTTTPAHELHAQLASHVAPFEVVPVRNVSGVAWIAALLAQAVLLAHALMLFRRYRMGSAA